MTVLETSEAAGRGIRRSALASRGALGEEPSQDASVKTATAATATRASSGRDIVSFLLPLCGLAFGEYGRLACRIPNGAGSGYAAWTTRGADLVTWH